jgi:hypothetical protein
MTWLLINLLLAALFFATWVGVPLWLVLKHPDQDARPRAASGPAHGHRTDPPIRISSAVLNDFTPLNIYVNEDAVGVCDYGKMSARGTSFNDVARFLASVEALEKYPFCNREITAQVQESFLDAYNVSPAEHAIIRVLKMRTLLSMFAQGRGVKESAVRKKVMWATVMKRFIQQAASRSLAPAA